LLIRRVRGANAEGKEKNWNSAKKHANFRARGRSVGGEIGGVIRVYIAKREKVKTGPKGKNSRETGESTFKFPRGERRVGEDEKKITKTLYI